MISPFIRGVLVDRGGPVRTRFWTSVGNGASTACCLYVISFLVCVCVCACACQTVLKEGNLMKQTNSFQRWKRRYFKLRGRTLYYAQTSKVIM